MNCLLECLAIEMPPKAREQAELSLQHGRLGFRSLVHHCSAACIASVLAHVTSVLAHITSVLAHIASVLAHITSVLAHITSVLALLHIASALDLLHIASALALNSLVPKTNLLCLELSIEEVVDHPNRQQILSCTCKLESAMFNHNSSAANKTRLMPVSSAHASSWLLATPEGKLYGSGHGHIWSHAVFTP